MIGHVPILAVVLLFLGLSGGEACMGGLVWEALYGGPIWEGRTYVGASRYGWYISLMGNPYTSHLGDLTGPATWNKP